MKTAKSEGNAALHLGNEVGARAVHGCSMCACVCVCVHAFTVAGRPCHPSCFLLGRFLCSTLYFFTDH